MRISPGWLTFLVGLLLLLIAGVIYQQSLVAGGQAGPGGAATAAPAQATMYVCPMHPQVRQDHPGTCPICGMELVPEEPATSTSPPASTQPGSAVAADQGEKLYTCPMHPQVVQDHPGTCPICGMELVPKETGENTESTVGGDEIASVRLSPTQQVLSDIDPIHPTSEIMALKIPGIGEVSVPQNQMKDIVSWQEGRIDNLLLAETGGEVVKGQHILDIYSEPLIQAQNEYLTAIRAVNELGDTRYDYIASSSKRLLEASQQKLLRLGFTAEDLAEIANSGKPKEHVQIEASQGGVILEKMASEGMYVMRGEKLFTVATLDPVWVEVNIFESDAASLKPGDRVALKCPIHPGMTFHGRIELIEPELDMATRTLRARVVVENPDMILRPGTVMDAELTVNYGKMLLLPRNAVLHTGDGDLVYVMKGKGVWEPRRVTVGRDFGDKVQIVGGLKPGEAVAGTAVFLLDSEAQLKGIPRPVDERDKGKSPDEGNNAGQ